MGPVTRTFNTIFEFVKIMKSASFRGIREKKIWIKSSTPCMYNTCFYLSNVWMLYVIKYAHSSASFPIFYAKPLFFSLHSLHTPQKPKAQTPYFLPARTECILELSTHGCTLLLSSLLSWCRPVHCTRVYYGECSSVEYQRGGNGEKSSPGSGGRIRLFNFNWRNQ